MLQAFRMELGNHCRCGFRHITASIPEFFELYQIQGCHQIFSKHLVAAGSCNRMVSRFMLVTIQPFWAPTNLCLTITLLASSSPKSWQTTYVNSIGFVYTSHLYFVVLWNIIQVLIESVSTGLYSSLWLKWNSLLSSYTFFFFLFSFLPFSLSWEALVFYFWFLLNPFPFIFPIVQSFVFSTVLPFSTYFLLSPDP